MGQRRAGHRALGGVAVRRLALAALPLGALLLGGCDLIGGISGAVSGATTGAVTANPAVGYAVGLGVRSATNAAIGGWMRGLKRNEQDAIARAAGEMAPGESRPWRIAHGLPFGYSDADGQLQVTRVIDTPLASCREVLFSVAGGKPEAPPEGLFVATACRQAEGWKWASAEPAVDRWGALQ